MQLVPTRSDFLGFLCVSVSGGRVEIFFAFFFSSSFILGWFGRSVRGVLVLLLLLRFGWNEESLEREPFTEEAEGTKVTTAVVGNK